MSNELSTLFPNKEVFTPDGRKIVVNPLTLEDLPKVKDAFMTIMQLSQEKKSNVEIAEAAMEEVLKILEHCINVPPKEVPFLIIPEIIDVVRRQNLTDEVVGKWMALVGKLGEIAPGGDQGSSKKG